MLNPHRVCTFVLASVASMCITACVPIPHSATLAPQMKGTVMRDGSPVENAIVNVSAESTSKTQMTSTDKSGAFSIPELVDWQLFIPLMGDYIQTFKLSIQSGDDHYLGWSQVSLYGRHLNPMTLKCDLAKAKAGRYGRSIYCEAVPDEP